MRKFALILLLLTFAGCTAKSAEEMGGYENKNLRSLELKISGMTCPSCASGIEYALKQKEGVVEVKVSYYEGKGEVIYDASKIHKEEIVAAIKPYAAEILGEKEFKGGSK